MLAASIVLAVALALAVTALVVLARRHMPGPPLSGRTVVVNTRRPDDQTIKGILHAQYADRWTLRNAVAVTPVGEKPLGGVQHIPVANIAWIQELPPAFERPKES